MDIKIVKGKSTEVTDELKAYCELKLSKLTRYGDRLQSATVTFTEKASKKRDKAFKVEAVLHAPGKTLRNVGEGSSLQAALDITLDEMREQLKKLKAKRQDKNREPIDLSQVAAKPKPEPAAKKAAPRRKLEVKKFTLKPMSVEEALMQLDMSGHTFYLFVNEQKSIHCVYKRSDGGYGLMVPETEIIQ